MKEIKLSNGMVALVDDIDFESINKHRWRCLQKSNTYYADRQDWNKGNPVTIRLHREILGLSHLDGIKVDHIDHNGLNNQRHNLRICNSYQNAANRKAKRNGTSPYLGVSWHKKNSKWVSHIRKNDVLEYLGSFTSEKEAALVYNKKAVELHGDFANLNKI